MATQTYDNGLWDMSGPEYGDGDDTVLVCFNGDENIRINAGTLSERKRLGRRIALLLNQASATLE